MGVVGVALVGNCKSRRRGRGRAKLRGEQRRPTRKARLKFSVARVESVAPRRRREKDCRVWSCCGDVWRAMWVAR